MSGRIELVFGLVGPIGCPIQDAIDALSAALKGVDYKPVPIHLSSEMDRLLYAKGAPIPNSGESQLENKIKKGNAVREAFGNDSVLAAEAIRQIIEFRRSVAFKSGETNDQKLDDMAAVPLDQHAFIVHQLKRPEEIKLLIQAFGKNFIQVSVVSPVEARRQAVVSRVRADQKGWDNNRCEKHADHLVNIDQNEKLEKRGQRISKIFHLGDVFLNAASESSLTKSADRFVEALFGKNNIGPTRDEFGSYMAKAASLRSVDLSRQVGAAITTPDGDIISIGCNEVPKFGGGNFWDEDDEKSKKRDIDLGAEANKSEVNRIVFNFLEILKNEKLISGDVSPEQIMENSSHRKAIKESLVAGITEYGRMVHAEMNAISDAVRLGRSVRGGNNFCYHISLS